MFLFTYSCKNTLVLTKVQYSNTKLDSTLVQIDTSLSHLILPYSERLDDKMNEIIGFAPQEFTKQKPESTLGNLLADATLITAEKYSSKKPDLAIINYGGIRVSNLAKGDITLGNVYEIMPFDNYLVTLEKQEDRVSPTGLIKEQVFKFVITVKGEFYKGVVNWTDNEKLTPKAYIRTIVFLNTTELFKSYGRNSG